MKIKAPLEKAEPERKRKQAVLAIACITLLKGNIKIRQGQEVGTVEKKKMGRPTDNPKSKPVHVRLDDECSEVLDAYCNKNGISRTEGIRRGIRKLKEEIG